LTDPILRVRSSGFQGSGYATPTELVDGKPRIVPSVTTIAGIADKPGLRQWAVEQTAGYAVTHVEALLNRSEFEGLGFLRYRWKNEPKLDADPDLRTWHDTVLNDAADLGTWMHEYVEARLLGEFAAAPETEWQAEMVEQFEAWLFEHDVEALLVEETVYNPRGYAGTLDLVVRVDGKCYLTDIKTSRNTWPEHYMQLAALGAAPVWLRQVAEGTPGAVEYKRKDKPSTYWVEDVVPDFEGYAILHIRPTDDDGKPAFCELKVIDNELIDMHYDWFLGYLTAKEAERRVKQWQNKNSKEEQ
jgi:hypothetical protein